MKEFSNPRGDATINRLVRPHGSTGVLSERYTLPETLGFSVLDYARQAQDESPLEGKRIVIVGMGDISVVTALEATRQGARVATVSRFKEDQTLIRGLGNAIQMLGGSDSFHIYADFKTKEDRARIIEESVDKMGEVDAMIITPGFSRNRPFASVGDEEVMDDLQVNLIAPVYMAREVADVMSRKQKHGDILIDSSIAGIGLRNSVGYSVAKGGLDALVLSLSQEYKRLHINATDPAFVKTRMVSAIDAGVLDKARETTLADRLLLAGELALLKTFLLSPNVDVTGQLVSMIGVGKEPAVDKFGLVIPQ